MFLVTGREFLLPVLFLSLRLRFKLKHFGICLLIMKLSIKCSSLLSYESNKDLSQPAESRNKVRY